MTKNAPLHGNFSEAGSHRPKARPRRVKARHKVGPNRSGSSDSDVNKLSSADVALRPKDETPSVARENSDNFPPVR